MPPIQPIPCATCGGGGAGGSHDVEPVVLCDINPATGEIVGAAIAVYDYDSTTGLPSGPPTFVIPGTNTPYVVQFTLQPCDSEGQSDIVELCDIQPDGSAVQFVRHYIIGPTGLVVSLHDSTLGGVLYTPTGTVQDCDPFTLCTPDSNIDLNADCGPGETAKQTVVAAAPGSPLANSVFVDDATADPLCGGTWNRGPSTLPVGFPVEESFRNTTFDDPGPVVQGTPTPFLTAGPPVNDGAGAGWFREADTSGGSNGLWQVPTAFSTAQGMNAAISWASHDGTIPGGDGQAFVFTDGSVAPQSAPVGGFGNLGLQNWQGGVFAIVLDEYGQTCTCDQTPGGSPNPGPCGFCSNTISIQRAGPSRIGATCACCTIASMPLAPKALNQTTRAQPVRLLTSVVTEAGQTYVSASLDWNDGNGPIQYFNRVNVTACVTVPATLRMAAYSGSGGAFQAIKEIRDAVARPAGVSNWRAFPITTDPIVCPSTGTPSLVNVSASVDVTPNDDGTQTAGNGNPELYFWLVNTATNTILDSDQYSILPSNIGTLKTLSISASVAPADLPNLRLYVGDESRDEAGEYDVTWDNLKVNATAAGCPATPRRTMEISARCPIPVAIVSGGTSGDSGGGGTTVVNTPSTFEDAVICATVGGVPTPAFRREIHLPDGTVDVTFIGTSGLPITPTAWTAGACGNPVFAGFVCDVFGGSPIVPAVPPSCPGGALQSPGNPFIGTGLTEAPAGTFTPTAGVNATYVWRGDPNTTEHGLCTVKFVNDPGTGDDPFWQLGGFFNDINGNPDGLNAAWITAIEGILGVGDASDIPAGSTATAVTGGGTSVTITFDGPSPHSQMFAGNGVFFVRENDADGLAAGVTLNFNPPVHDFQLVYNATPPSPGSTSGHQESQATAGTPAIPAQPATVTTVKQFRNVDGTSFYENLDGTAHTVTGTIGDCGEYSQEVLCDRPSGTQFLRVYKIAGGTIASFQDYTLAGAPYAVVGTPGPCDFNVTVRDSELELLCWTETSTGNVTQFLRHYLYSQDGVTLDTTIDTLLDGTTAFNASNLGTVAACSDAGLDVEVEVLCDSTPTRFLRKYVYNATTGVFASITDTLLDGTTAFAPVGAVTTCPVTATATVARDEEVLVLCDSAVTPVKFLRKYNYDVTTGALIGITNTQLDGSTAFVPTGAVQVCPVTTTTDLDFFIIELCDNNGGFLRRFTFNSTTGAVTATTNTTLAGVAYVPVGTVAICDGCCPVVVGEGCTNTGSGKYVAIRSSAGVISLFDSVTGAAVLAANVIVCPSDDVVKTLTAQARQLTNATPWTPGADVVGTLTSLSVTGVSGLWDMVDQNGTVLTGLPAGLTLTWSALDDNTLTGPTSVTPQVGSSVVANWTQR